MPGFTVWLTGCPGAGKTTIARRLYEHFTASGHPVEVLDGDEVRQTLSPDLGFSRRDRDANVRRLGFIARLLARNGVIAIVAAVSPYRGARDKVRHSHEARFIEVFVDCPIGELIRRDQKGLYTRAVRGEVASLTGISDPYEPPLAPEVHVHTDRESPDECVARILAMLDEPGVGAVRQRAGAPASAAGPRRALPPGSLSA